MGENNTTTTTQQQGIQLNTSSAFLLGICITIFLIISTTVVVVLLFFLFANINKRLKNTFNLCKKPDDDPIEIYTYKGEKYPSNFIQPESGLVCKNAEFSAQSEEK